MRLRYPFILVSVAAILCVASSTSHAGLNAGARAHLYWQIGGGIGLDSRCTISYQPQLVVTVTGLQNFRGASVSFLTMPSNFYAQLNPVVYASYPAAWDMTSTGCAADNMQIIRGGVGGAYLNAYSTSPAVPGVATGQENMYDGSTFPLCFGTLHGSQKLIWFDAVGTAGKARDPNVEYAVCAMRFDLRGTTYGGTTDCQGDLSHGAIPVTIRPYLSEYCTGGPGAPSGPYLMLLDANNAVDFVPFDMTSASGLGWLALYYGDNCDQPNPPYCIPMITSCSQTSVKTRTWGEMRRLYR